MKELDQRAMELANAEEDCRRAINMATKDYNNALVWKTLDIEVLKDFLGTSMNHLKPYTNLDVEYLNNTPKVTALIYGMSLFWK